MRSERPPQSWVPEPETSTTTTQGAPRGTIFLGAAANVENVVRHRRKESEAPGRERYERQYRVTCPEAPLAGYEGDPKLKRWAEQNRGPIKLSYDELLELLPYLDKMTKRDCRNSF